MTNYIKRTTVLTLINDVKSNDGFTEYAMYNYLFNQVDTMPGIDVPDKNCLQGLQGTEGRNQNVSKG